MREFAEEYQDTSRFQFLARYDEWDADMNYGCVCDSGWTGFDCGTRQCPLGDDPMTVGNREIQTVRTTATHRDEVQTILLTADYDDDEVQRVRVYDLQPASGDFPIIGSFALVFDSTTAGGFCKICAFQGVGKTPDIAMDATATGSSGISMQEKLQDITPAVIDQVKVSQTPSRAID
jgi:hypothetical protein